MGKLFQPPQGPGWEGRKTAGVLLAGAILAALVLLYGDLVIGYFLR